MKHILKFYINIGIILASLFSFAQESNKIDSVVVKNQKYGLRVGTDLYKIARSIYDENYQGFEISGDFRINKKFYAAAEIGNENKLTDETQINFTTKGTYLKIGFDYNAYENWLDMQNMIYVGARYGSSYFSQNLNEYSIYYNTGGFLGEHTTILSNQKFNQLNAHWLELVAGVKAEVLKNLYLGFSVRIHYLITDKAPNNFENLYIPGFNRTYDGNFGAGFNYTVSYLIPLYKK